MKRFENKSYIVLDLPESDFTRSVLRIRQVHEPWRMILPVEITAAGSSGVGVFDRELQDQEVAFQILVDLAAQREKPFVAFERVTTFPETNLFYLEPKKPEFFHDLQRSFIQAGLKFEKSPFPFTPHCTIADLGENPSSSALSELRAFQVPKDSFPIAGLSLYSLTPGECRKIAWFPFQDPIQPQSE